MDFERAERYLDSFLNYEKMSSYDPGKFDLTRITKFLNEYGVDYGRLKYVHVAGSKGKGSVCNLIGHYLWREGYEVGIYTSPHILSITERFWLNGAQISDEKFVSMVDDLRKFIEGRGGECELTYFELLTVMALKLYVDSGVQCVVLEVGLGGRLDATNVVNAQLSIITPIELEHLGVLGNNLAEIVTEKLGIVEEGKPVLIGKQTPDAESEIRLQLAEKSEVHFVEDFELPSFPFVRDQARIENGKTAFCALKLLLGEVDEKLFFEVLGKARLLGRFDLRKIEGKKVIFDMAHTVNSMRNLVEAIPSLEADRVLFLVSILKGKDVPGMLALIRSVADEIVFTSCHKERGYTGRELADIWEKEFPGESYGSDEDANEAYGRLFQGMKKNQLLVVTGSHFLVSKVLEGTKSFL